VSIRQLPACCHVFTDPAEDEERHYADLQDASAALIEARKDNPETKAGTAHLDYRCWVVQCDGECEETLDEEGECTVYHHESIKEAEKTAAGHGYRLATGPLGETLAYCDEDAPEIAEAPPLSPEEQERAGQQRLPGIIP
jgi:hypothetical protein